MKLNSLPAILFVSFIFNFLISCGGDDKNVTEKESVVLKNDKPRSKNDTTPRSAPIINISDTTAYPYFVICIKDSAINSVRLSQKLAKIYSERLVDIIRKNKLKVVGPPMAWYKSQRAPFFFEAGFPVDKKPTKLAKGVTFKKTGGVRTIVAHFYGPYTETVQAYQALKDWLKDNNKKQAGPPYEIYIGNPIDKDGHLVDPYKVQTDIIFPYN